MAKKTLDEIVEALKGWVEHQAMSIEIKDKTIVCNAKSIAIRPSQLVLLAEIVEGRLVRFGRSGANFRMIIS